MNKRLKKKWVKALRSGEYNQSIGRLQTRNEEGVESFCCLGVLCEVAKVNVLEEAGTKYYSLGKKDGAEAYTGLTQAMLDKWDINTYQQSNLIDLNDTKKKSFEEIADYIEENL
jgi:hypothetical protein